MRISPFTPPLQTTNIQMLGSQQEQGSGSTAAHSPARRNRDANYIAGPRIPRSRNPQNTPRVSQGINRYHGSDEGHRYARPSRDMDEHNINYNSRSGNFDVQSRRDISQRSSRILDTCKEPRIPEFNNRVPLPPRPTPSRQSNPVKHPNAPRRPLVTHELAFSHGDASTAAFRLSNPTSTSNWHRAGHPHQDHHETITSNMHPVRRTHSLHDNRRRVEDPRPLSAQMGPVDIPSEAMISPFGSMTPWRAGIHYFQQPMMTVPLAAPHMSELQHQQHNTLLSDGAQIYLDHSVSTAIESNGPVPTLTDHGRDQLREQLEYYFSPSNLTVDRFLLSHMDDERYVPISVIAEFKRVKAVTENMSEIVAALRRSSVVIVDPTGSKVKPSPPKPRTTLIIRDLPHDVEAKEILAVFEDGGCPAKGITREVANTWFVEFNKEEDALAMHTFIRGKKLRGVPLAARLKSNTSFVGGLSSDSSVSSHSAVANASSPLLQTDQSVMSNIAPHSPSYGRQPYRRFPLDFDEHLGSSSNISNTAEFAMNITPQRYFVGMEAPPLLTQEDTFAMEGYTYIPTKMDLNQYQCQWPQPGSYIMNPFYPIMHNPGPLEQRSIPPEQYAQSQEITSRWVGHTGCTPKQIASQRRDSGISHSSTYSLTDRRESESRALNTQKSRHGYHGKRGNTDTSGIRNSSNSMSINPSRIAEWYIPKNNVLQSGDLRKIEGNMLPMPSEHIRCHSRQGNFASASSSAPSFEVQDRASADWDFTLSQRPQLLPAAQPAPTKKKKNKKKKATKSENRAHEATVVETLTDQVLKTTLDDFHKTKSTEKYKLGQSSSRDKNGSSHKNDCTKSTSSRSSKQQSAENIVVDVKTNDDDGGILSTIDNSFFLSANFPPLSSSTTEGKKSPRAVHVPAIPQDAPKRPQGTGKTKWQPIEFASLRTNFPTNRFRSDRSQDQERSTNDTKTSTDNGAPGSSTVPSVNILRKKLEKNAREDDRNQDTQMLNERSFKNVYVHNDMDMHDTKNESSRSADAKSMELSFTVSTSASSTDEASLTTTETMPRYEPNSTSCSSSTFAPGPPSPEIENSVKSDTEEDQ